MQSIDHYKHYPIMMPWVGKNYVNSNLHKKLLIIGESHYLPKKSTIHTDAISWYKNDCSSLTDKEKLWISTSVIIKNNINSNFKIKAHGIYRNFCKEINSIYFNYSNPAIAIDHIAFYNYFQRPADSTGDSIKVHEKDIEIANEVLSGIIDALEPALVIFTSSLAGKHGKSTVKKHDIPFAITPHPTCPWWNRFSKKYNGKGREIIGYFLKKQKWHH